MFVQAALVFLHIVLHFMSQKKASYMEQDAYQTPFYYNLHFTYLVSAYAHVVPKYKETGPDVQFTVLSR